MSLLNKLKLGIAAVGLVGLLSCGGEETSNSTSGCTSNAQCKAGRVCVKEARLELVKDINNILIVYVL